MSETEVLYRDAEGRELALAEIAAASGPMPTDSPETEAPNEQAGRLHELGRAAGQIGQYELALERFAEAEAAGEGWLYPRYDAAFTELYMQRQAEAEATFAALHEAAPWGFLNTLVALDLLRREREGLAEPGLTITLTMVEGDPERIRRSLVLKAIVAANPAVPRAWQLLAEVTRDNDKRLTRVERGLSYHPDPTTHGMLSIHRAWIRFGGEGRQQSIDELGALALDPDTPRDVNRRARWSLARLLFG